MHISHRDNDGWPGLEPRRQSPPPRSKEASEHRRRDRNSRDLDRTVDRVALMFVRINRLRQREAANKTSRTADDGARAERAEPRFG